MAARCGAFLGHLVARVRHQMDVALQRMHPGVLAHGMRCGVQLVIRHWRAVAASSLIAGMRYGQAT